MPLMPSKENAEYIIDQLFGVSIDEFLVVKKKLTIMGISLKYLIEFLDRSEVQLYAEQCDKIAVLENKLRRINEFVNKENENG